MLRIFRKKISGRDPDSSSGEFLNAALNAYVATFPQEPRLTEFLSGRDALPQFTEVKNRLDSVVKSAEEYLYSQTGGVNWTKEFEQAFYLHLAGQHPWLSDAGFRSIVSFGGWLCWHEGLNA